MNMPTFNIAKFNLFRSVPELWGDSRILAGKTYYLSYGGWLRPKNPLTEGWGDGPCVLRPIGRILESTGKFGKLSKIIFPANAAQVRNFIRLVTRTRLSAVEAAQLSGSLLIDLSAEYDAAIHAPANRDILTCQN